MFERDRVLGLSKAETQTPQIPNSKSETRDTPRPLRSREPKKRILGCIRGFPVAKPFRSPKREDCSELWSSSFRAALVGFGIHILVRAFEVAGLSSILVVVKAGLCTETTSDKVQRSIDTSSFL